MRWSKYFIPTVKEVPADATVASHRLLIRAGYIRQVTAGAYTYLPLGYRVLRKVENIIREEMDAAGAVELFMPAMHPIELWEETGRVEAMGQTLVQLADKPFRKGTVLGPTHEEIVTDTVRAFVNSYKQLPLNLYQIQTKFRDEERPKSGVLRTREFQMKDAYSFHVVKEGPGGLDETYQVMYDAYCRIYDRCGLRYAIVEAESGPIGGDASHEFMAVTDAGEDWLVECGECGYAANLERAEAAAIPETAAPAPLPTLTEVETPNQRTIDEVCGFLKREPASMIKTLVYVDGDGKPLVALVRGDHEINESKLGRAAGVTGIELGDAETIRKLTGAEVGFAGPHTLQARGARVICDQAVSVMHGAATGANKTGYHVVGLEPGRDFELTDVADIRSAVEGDGCPKCGAAMRFKKCIEIGHVFKLGTKYSQAMKATVLDAEGKPRTLIMGCYGIGLNRILAAAVELGHDDNGITWPMNIAPFQVLIVALDVREEEVKVAAEGLYDQLTAQGVEVLLDDRDARPGFKFKDADLIGIPIRVTIGKRGLKDGIVEIKARCAEEAHKVAPGAAVETIMKMRGEVGG
ncbi:MAG: proline--tRNA ligase [Phycisphaerae bacterium]|nr:proline--tRNA ligase [Phycisphaerae bacterium]